MAYRSSVDAAVLGSGHDVSLTANEETLGKGLVLGGAVTADDGGDGLHLLGLDLFACRQISHRSFEVRPHRASSRFHVYLQIGRGSPGAVAGGADDGALGDVAGADKAIFPFCVNIVSSWGAADCWHSLSDRAKEGRASLPGIDVCCVAGCGQLVDVCEGVLPSSARGGAASSSWIAGGGRTYLATTL